MKITKRQLKRIIKEEKLKLLEESPMPMRSRLDPYVARIIEAPYGPVGAEEYNVGYARDKNRVEMSEKTAEAVQDLQTAYVNLEELALGPARGAGNAVVVEMFKNLELIKDAIHTLGGNLP